MVKFEYRYVGDWAVLCLALVVFGFAFYSALLSESNLREAYSLTADCLRQKEQIVAPWVLKDPINYFDNWTKEVDVNVSVS